MNADFGTAWLTRVRGVIGRIAAISSVLLITGCETAAPQPPGDCFDPTLVPTADVRSEVLTRDAATVWVDGDYVRFEDDRAQQFRDGVPILEFDRAYFERREPGFILLGSTINDLQALVKEEPDLCHFEEHGFWCHIGRYYCSCYYGDPDGEGAGCSCGDAGGDDVCGRAPLSGGP